MSTILPSLLTGISVGGQYALIAIGYTMVYGILRLINFAHGDVFMVAGILMVYLNASGLPQNRQCDDHLGQDRGGGNSICTHSGCCHYQGENRSAGCG